MRTEELLKYDNQHVLHGLSVVGQYQDYIVESANGVMLTDTDGKTFMDLSSQAISVNLGHGRQDIADVAREQMVKLTYAMILRGFVNLPSIELAQKLATIIPKGLEHFMWTHTGSETVDLAFRAANLYWKSKGTRKYKIISLYNAFHGTLRSVTGASNVNKGVMEEVPPAPGHVHIPNYYCYHCPYDKEYPGCGILCAKFLEYTIDNEGRDSVAAFIAEPIQGPGGFLTPPPEYWSMVREICRKYDVLLIADEVMTGFARTGKMFAVEHWNMIPDMMALSKGIVGGYLPFGALAMTGEVLEGLSGHFFPGGSTHSGNPVCCAVASKCIDIYVNERIPEHVAEVGKRAKSRLEKEFLPLPHVGKIDGLGLMLGIEIVTDKKTRGLPAPGTNELIQRRGKEKGAYFRVMQNKLCYSPPCTITQEQSDRGLDIVYSVLSQLKAQDLT